MSRASKWLSLLLVFGLLLGPCLAYSEPFPSSSSVSLSQSEYDQIVAEIQAAQIALQTSNDLIAKQSKDLKMLSLLSGALAAGLILEGAAMIIVTIKH